MPAQPTGSWMSVLIVVGAGVPDEDAVGLALVSSCLLATASVCIDTTEEVNRAPSIPPQPTGSWRNVSGFVGPSMSSETVAGLALAYSSLLTTDDSGGRFASSLPARLLWIWEKFVQDDVEVVIRVELGPEDVDVEDSSSVCVTVTKIVSVTTGRSGEGASCGKAKASARRVRMGIVRYITIGFDRGLFVVVQEREFLQRMGAEAEQEEKQGDLSRTSLA